MNARKYNLRKVQLIGGSKFINLSPELLKGEQMCVIEKDNIFIILPVNMYNAYRDRIEQFFEDWSEEI